MRVLHAVEVSHGGVTTLVRQFAAWQTASRHDIHVIAPSTSPVMDATVHRWDPRRSSPRRLLAAHRQLARVVEDIRPDVVHLHSFVPGLLGRTGALGPTAVVYQPHSWAFGAVPTRLGAFTVSRWESWALRHTHAVVTNCQEELDEAGRCHVTAPEKSSVIGLPVDAAHFHPAAPEDVARHRTTLGLTTPHVLVCVGRLSRQKGQVALAEWWERAPLVDTTLVLVGPGDPRDIADRAPKTFGASLLHVGGQDDVRPWLWASDLCVQPSLYEGQSVAMAEALCCAVPVVITAVNGAREAVTGGGHGSAGAVVPIGDMRALLDACAALLACPDRRARAAAAARATAARLFDPAAVMARLTDVYRRAVADAKIG